ncbi:MAG: prolyl oligopeptidase family serine peptidase [Ignavibacteriota bacterium]
MKKYILLTIIVAMSYCSISAQSDTASVTEKKILDHSVYTNWKKLENVDVSNDGRFSAFEVNRQKGDGVLTIRNLSNEDFTAISRGYDCTFSPNNDFVAFKIKTPDDSLRKLKVLKKKKETFPKDSLGIILLNGTELKGTNITKISNLISYKIPEEKTSAIAYMKDSFKKKDTLSKSDIDIFDLTVLNPVKNISNSYENVYEYAFSKSGDALVYMSLKKGKTDTTQVYILKKDSDKPELIFTKAGYGKSLAIDNAGGQMAFIHTQDTAKIKRYVLYYSNTKAVKLAADNNSTSMPANWEVSPYSELKFSDNGKNLYYQTAPKLIPEPKDTLIDEEKFKVDVWNYQDPYLQTQQLHDLDKTKKKNYLAMYDVASDKTYPVEDLQFEKVRNTKSRNSDYYLGIDQTPYKRSSSWIQPDQFDLYSLSPKNNVKNLIAEGVQQGYSISPTGKYITWFENSDTSYYLYNNETGSKFSLTKSLPVKFGNELNDVPNVPDAYGIGGWTTNDDYVLIYDRYDVWKLNTQGLQESVKITNGRPEQTVYRIQDLNKDVENIGLDDKTILKVVNETNWQEGYYSVKLSDGVLNKLIMLDNKFIAIDKAKNSEVVTFQKCSYTEFSDLWVSDLSFKEIKKISDANPQMKDYLWGTVEIVNWKDFNGNEQKGLIYKPEDFDGGKKYPMITYFYEKYTDKFHTHYIPNPSRSVVNFPVYNSNGYIIFIPDISYEVGHPGKSAYNVILSGAQYLADTYTYIDRDNLGLQGQSWGGYQVAYMVTQTDFFKSAMAGAPVSNMTSAYGGIRWESGVNRIFQYEKEQSRIGGTLWDKFDLFIENSPLFFANKVNTPLLIMANDGDGAVPWQQGIEYFVSLRRLDKVVYMLNYNGDEHNLMKWPNRVDLSIRMKQFFDYYLKGEKMPDWMKDGLPATQKGLKNGY